jgi:hypothetical protein
MPRIQGLVRFVPPIIVGLGLAIMEVASQARLGYFDAPVVIEAIGSYVSSWFLGMVVTAVGAYLFALVGRVSWLGLFGYAMNALAWEDILYWSIRWHTPYMWVFYMHGFTIPYVVWHNIPIDTLTAFAISYALLLRNNRFISKKKQ